MAPSQGGTFQWCISCSRPRKAAQAFEPQNLEPQLSLEKGGVGKAPASDDLHVPLALCCKTSPELQIIQLSSAASEPGTLPPRAPAPVYGRQPHPRHPLAAGVGSLRLCKAMPVSRARQEDSSQPSFSVIVPRVRLSGQSLLLVISESTSPRRAVRSSLYLSCAPVHGL